LERIFWCRMKVTESIIYAKSLLIQYNITLKSLFAKHYGARGHDTHDTLHFKLRPNPASEYTSPAADCNLGSRQAIDGQRISIPVTFQVAGMLVGLT
jgi:hypothetical protein